MLYPFNQKVLYDIQPSVFASVASLVAIGTIVTAAWYFRKSYEITSSLCWFLLFLLPVVNIILLPAASIMADRYGYISLMGFALFLAYVISKAPLKISFLIVTIICVIYATVDIARNTYWKDGYSFTSQMIVDAPEMAIGYYNKGINYYQRGDMDNAERFLLRANAQKDISPRFLSSASSVLWETGRLESAEKVLQHLLKLEPANPQSYQMLKMLYAKQGKTEQAKTYGDKASKLFPGIQEVMNKRVVDVCSQAEAFITMRSFEKAENLLREALTINPDFVPALIDMGSINAEKGDSEKAVGYFTKAVALEPLNATAHFNLAQVYEMQGKTAAANDEMRKFKESEALQKKSSESSQAPPGAVNQ